MASTKSDPPVYAKVNRLPCLDPAPQVYSDQHEPRHLASARPPLIPTSQYSLTVRPQEHGMSDKR